MLLISVRGKERGGQGYADDFARGKFSPISPVVSSGENLTGENFDR